MATWVVLFQWWLSLWLWLRCTAERIFFFFFKSRWYGATQSTSCWLGASCASVCFFVFFSYKFNCHWVKIWERKKERKEKEREMQPMIIADRVLLLLLLGCRFLEWSQQPLDKVVDACLPSCLPATARWSVSQATRWWLKQIGGELELIFFSFILLWVLLLIQNGMRLQAQCDALRCDDVADPHQILSLSFPIRTLLSSSSIGLSKCPRQALYPDKCQMHTSTSLPLLSSTCLDAAWQ